MRRAVLFVVLASTAAALPACKRDGCVGGDDGHCLPPSACQALRYECSPTAGALRVFRITDGTQRVPGPKSLAAVGDFVLENDRLRAVLDDPTHPQGLAPTGGTIIDLAPKDATGAPVGDQTNGIFQGVGLLPRDAAHYDSWTILDESVAQTTADAFVAVVFRGHIDGDTRVTVVTRYELRACEPGLRVRTDVYNGARDPNTLYLTDGFFWGDNGLIPFVPVAGLGFLTPDLDLLHLSDAWRQWPFMAARPQSAPEVAYAVVPCDRPVGAGFNSSTLSGAGFNSSTLSGAGIPLVTTLAGDGLSYERFILAVPGPGVAPAVHEAMIARAQTQGDAPAVAVTGRVVTNAGPLDGHDGRVGSLLFYEPAASGDPDAETARLPRSEAVPGADGRFQVWLPPNRVYHVQPYAFGLPASSPSSFAVASTPLAIGDITLARASHLVATVETTPGVRGTFAELVLIPFDAPVATAAVPSLYGQFAGCDPMLGPPHGGSPACNRALTTNGQFDLLVPPGHYYVYATRGPFASLDRREITLDPGDEADVSLLTSTLDSVVPTGTLSGDFHVHGGASFDSAIPDQDRVVSFLASGVDVIVATDHDVVTSYADTLATLGVGDDLIVIPGVEETPNILWFDVPGQQFPRTLGHFNFWPLTPDTTAPRNGAPWDELREPGRMMDDMEALYADPGGGVRQMNHPWLAAKLGRDQGFLRAIGMDPRRSLTDPDNFAGNVLLRRPGTHFRNIDFDVQEVMTGASRRDWLRYRTLWFSLLSQGYLRAGAANSDSHTLSVERIGYPRNLVFGGHARATFDREAFDADVRAGHMIGTNGPVLDATIDDAAGVLHRAGLTSFIPAPHATLTVAITAAPWIPVTEVRVFVNGTMKKVVDVSQAFAGVNHFGLAAIRDRITIALDATVLPATGDAWVVVEAGLHQDLPLDDEDGVSDGLPDLPDDEVPTRPPNAGEPDTDRFDLEAIAPGVWPTAFTNPFLLDRNGDGTWTPPGLP